MPKKMKILITNDDGYYSDGIKTLFKELSKKHDVLLVAPDREQSASSHSLTLNHPLRLHKIDKIRYVTDGTPTDCVMLAVHLLFKNKKPDMIISGINHGANMGDDLTYSGTVAAAIEGSILQIPSIAVSMANYIPGTPMINAAKFVNRLINKFEKFELDSSTFLNVNLPLDNGKQYKNFEFTKLGYRQYNDIVIRKTDPRGKDYYWIGGKPKWKSTKGSDFEAVKRGMVSITPIKMDFTNLKMVDKLSRLDIKI
ncbi:MAG: 5'/3'-nucleotidase SurE [candidate division Zixibacteria bacterium]|nr:5'/3'-nucleotidase SurE [candidate division Zixibacteria bacterium]